MVVEDYKAFIANTMADVNSGAIPLSRIDDAVSRILRVKIRSGLFEKGRPSSRPYAGKSELMGAESHREIARQAVRESLVLLKNNKSTLPLSPNQHILVAGDGDDNMARGKIGVRDGRSPRRGSAPIRALLLSSGTITVGERRPRRL